MENGEKEYQGIGNIGVDLKYRKPRMNHFIKFPSHMYAITLKDDSDSITLNLKVHSPDVSGKIYTFEILIPVSTVITFTELDRRIRKASSGQSLVIVVEYNGDKKKGDSGVFYFVGVGINDPISIGSFSICWPGKETMSKFSSMILVEYKDFSTLKDFMKAIK